MALTDKQQRFCEEYLIDLNATQAAIRAGYSEKTANEQGSRLLANVSIQSVIRERQNKLQSKTEITQERVLKEYARLAFFDIRNIYDDNGRLMLPGEMDDDSAAAVAGIDVYEEKFDGMVIGHTKKVKLHSKTQALEALGKHLGIFNEDNKQKKTTIDLDKLPPEVIKALLNAGR